MYLVCEFDNLVIVNVVPSVLRDNIVTISADFQQGTELYLFKIVIKNYFKNNFQWLVLCQITEYSNIQ